MTGEPEPTPDFIRDDGDGVVFRIDAGVYGAIAILAALHRFTARCFVHVEREPGGLLLCRVVPRSPGNSGRDLAGQLANEILDQTLRHRLQEETEPIRRLLLAQAFSRTNILHPELDDADPEADLAGIILPDLPFRREPPA